MSNNRESRRQFQSDTGGVNITAVCYHPLHFLDIGFHSPQISVRLYYVCILSLNRKQTPYSYNLIPLENHPLLSITHTVYDTKSNTLVIHLR